MMQILKNDKKQVGAEMSAPIDIYLTYNVFIFVPRNFYKPSKTVGTKRFKAFQQCAKYWALFLSGFYVEAKWLFSNGFPLAL